MREGPEPEVRERTNSKNGREDHKSGVLGQNFSEKLMRREKTEVRGQKHSEFDRERQKARFRRQNSAKCWGHMTKS